MLSMALQDLKLVVRNAESYIKIMIEGSMTRMDGYKREEFRFHCLMTGLSINLLITQIDFNCFLLDINIGVLG